MFGPSTTQQILETLPYNNTILLELTHRWTHDGLESYWMTKDRYQTLHSFSRNLMTSTLLTSNRMDLDVVTFECFSVLMLTKINQHLKSWKWHKMILVIHRKVETRYTSESETLTMAVDVTKSMTSAKWKLKMTQWIWIMISKLCWLVFKTKALTPNWPKSLGII